MAYAKVVNGLAHLKNKLQFRDSFFKLAPDKTYIVPTGFGFSFGALSFILLVMAIGYGNNILYFFVFLLVSMGLTSAWQTNKNIESVKINELRFNALFANEQNKITAVVENLNSKNINIWDLEFKIEYREKLTTDFYSLDEVRDTAELNLIWQPSLRGYVKSPRILIRSRFPFKMLRAWKYYHRPIDLLVYPERKGLYAIEALLGQQSQNDNKAKQDNEGLFRDYREFQNSDSPSRIDWRQSVKHQKHLVKNYEKSGERKILIDWDMTKNIQGFEDRVSQLALWIQLCFDRNESFSLKIGNEQTDYFSSINHYKSCLEKLALLTQQDVA